MRQIGKYIGARHREIQLLRENPCYNPSRALVERLEELHENVLTGTHRWGRMVAALLAQGWTYEHLAVRLEMSQIYLRTRFMSPTRIPLNRLGVRIERLYEAHIRKG